MRVEIRCCCTTELLGTVEVNEESLRSSRIAFLLHERPTCWYRTDQKLRSLCLEVGIVDIPNKTRYKALKAHNVPLATLQQIPTFEPWKR